MSKKEEPANQNQQQTPPIVINTQYIKDLSLEIPHAPDIFRNLDNKKPEINIDVNVNTILSSNVQLEHLILSTGSGEINTKK